MAESSPSGNTHHVKGRLSLILSVATALIAPLVTSCVNADSGSRRERFEPASSVEETFRWHRAHPTTTAWWDIVGEQQAWYFKNLQQLYPSVTVYRDGPIRELDRRAMA